MKEDRLKNIKLFFNEYGKVFTIVLLLIVICFSLYFIFGKSEGEMKVIFFDVGQGDSIFIQTPSGKQMIIDGGRNDKVMNELDKEMPIFDRTIDVMIATHADADHVTGLIPILEKYKVDNIIESNVQGTTAIFKDLESHIQKENAKLYIAKTGDEINFNDGVVVKILYPSVSCGGGTNECSVSVLVTYLDKSFLLTGDLPTTRENKLVESGLLPKDVTVYKAGHHGSKYSSGEQLLSYIHPYYAVISAGKDNRYGHPNIETMDRLHKYANVILSTIDSGDIEFDISGNNFEYKLGK